MSERRWWYDNGVLVELGDGPIRSPQPMNDPLRIAVADAADYIAYYETDRRSHDRAHTARKKKPTMRKSK